MPEKAGLDHPVALACMIAYIQSLRSKFAADTVKKIGRARTAGMLILLAILLAAPTDRGDAKNRHGITAKERAAYRKLKRDLWGPAKMPPAPTDFGPHFDFPPAPLNGGLTQDPYPN